MPAHDVEVQGVVVPRGAGLPPILDGADLSVIAGERHALVGPSGSGKTTLARVVLGRLAPARGDVRVGPFRLPVAAADRAAFARSVGWIAQDAAGSLDPTFTALELVAEPCLVHGACGRREAAERARDALARAGLPADAALRRPGELSGGQCQRVAVARALALSPGLVVADEPTSALDPLLQAAVLDLLSSLCAGAGATLLLVAHSPGVVRRWCDRVSLVQGGRVHASFQAASFDPPAGAP